jgi:hypothetical protein
MTAHTTKQRLLPMVRAFLQAHDGEPPHQEEVEAAMLILLEAPDLMWLALEDLGLAGRDIIHFAGEDGMQTSRYRRYERDWRH